MEKFSSKLIEFFVSNDLIKNEDKEIYEYALELNGVSAEQTLMIGDNYESDIKGAFNAGIKAVLFNPHKKSVPDDVYQIFSLQELFDIL